LNEQLELRLVRHMVNFGAAYALGRTTMGETGDRRGTWAILIVLLLVLFLLLSRCTGSNGSSRVGAVPNSAGPAEPAPASTSTANSGEVQVPDDEDDNEPVPGDGTLTVQGEPILPLSEAGENLSRYSGKRAVARQALVLSVPADEGFWVGTGGSDRVWVQLTGRPPESPYVVSAGDRVSFTARVTPNRKGFAQQVGVTRAEGAGTLTAQRQHLNVPKRGLDLRHP
jgi:hypothetical protein